ncbi:MAG: hypothetical protein LBE92_11930 [Chryseobacterium sp.]|jgi:hypothetical protein|uniref:hypothetical protein n=1 Tax=Chryseobacterium sp. TaxID=1871047 RepID=UPI00282FE823|nr:hypothetical protein [Chryseobacterium sp.]MDR2236823.1 hypothetical protein [Chryseobacterium sp.]
MQNRFFLFFFTALFICISAQPTQSVFLKQDLLFRPSVTLKDYGLKGKVKKVELVTFYTDSALKKSYQTLYFSDTGVLIQNSFYSENEKANATTFSYHYRDGRLNSITTATGTGKQIFSYDSSGRLIRKDSYGKYEEDKHEVDETESYHYNSQDYIIKSAKTNLITECKYNNNHQIREIRSYYADKPSEVSVTEYQFKTLAEKPYTVVTKNNGKINETENLQYDNRENMIESVTIGSDSTKNTSTHRIAYDRKGNIISETVYIKGKEFSTTTKEIEYGSL